MYVLEPSRLGFVCLFFLCFIKYLLFIDKKKYSALTLDLAATSYFLLFQVIKLPPINTQYPKVERLSVGELGQFASHHNIQQYECDLYFHITPLGSMFL